MEFKRLNDELAAARAEIAKSCLRDQQSHEDYKYQKNRADDALLELNTVTEQRDRLAKALEQCRDDSVELLGERDWWQHEPRCDYKKRYQETRDNVTRADEALKSLTTNDQTDAPKGCVQ